MHIIDLIGPDRIRCCQNVVSKKRVLEQLSQLLSENTPDIKQEDIFDSLLDRERLGSTGFGNGVAIPHSRIPGLTAPVAAFIKLDQGIDFDSIDDQPVDLLFGLLVPSDSSEDHLSLLAQLAQMISEPDLCRALRETDNPDDIHKSLCSWVPEHASA